MVIIWLLLIGVWLWALIDECLVPEWAYQRAHSSKALWIVLTVFFGAIAGAIYLIGIRSKVRRAAQGGPAPLGAVPTYAPATVLAGGARPGRFCPSCGVAVTPIDRHCGGCGASLGTGS